MPFVLRIARRGLVNFKTSSSDYRNIHETNIRNKLSLFVIIFCKLKHFVLKGVSLQCNHSLVHTSLWLLLWEIEEVQAAAAILHTYYSTVTIHICDGEENSRCLVKLCVHYTWSHIYKFVAPWARSSANVDIFAIISQLLLLDNDISKGNR